MLSRSEVFPFQSTPPGWEATNRHTLSGFRARHFNPRLPGGRRRGLRLRPAVFYRAISIHASRVGGDDSPLNTRKDESISIHASRVGGDDHGVCSASAVLISIHASRVGGDAAYEVLAATYARISIHASRVGGDTKPNNRVSHGYPFQSTPPGWEATGTERSRDDAKRISIHASRVGGDMRLLSSSNTSAHFNPRLPGGRRPFCAFRPSTISPFQSTPPGWEATSPKSHNTSHVRFQSTPPGWEATVVGVCKPDSQRDFNPRLPGGRRRISVISKYDGLSISIHASRVGGDAPKPMLTSSPATFQSTPPGWEATQLQDIIFTPFIISIHASRVGGDALHGHCAQSPFISIHASRVGGDEEFLRLGVSAGISIHASRVGGDTGCFCR